MTPFLVSANKRLNEDSLLILNFFFIAFMLGWKTTFSIMEPIVSFLDDTEVCPGQLKRFNKSVIDSKCLLKVEATSFCFDNNLSFSSSITFFCILLFLFDKYGLHAFQNGLELQSTLSLSKYCNLTYLFRFVTRFRCRLNLTMSIGFLALFWRLISLVLETWSDHYLLPKLLIKIGCLIPS